MSCDSSSGYMRAHDWMMLVTVLAVYAFRDTLPTATLHIFLRYCEVMTALTARTAIVAELDALQLSVVECLSLIELHLPNSEMTIIFHLLLHCVHYIRLWGPISSFWMYPMERYVGFLARGISNRSRPTAMLTRFYRFFNIGEFFRPDFEYLLRSSPAGAAYLDRLSESAPSDGLEIMAHPFSPHIPKLLGVPSSFTMSDLDLMALQTTFRLVHGRYELLCSTYEQERKLHLNEAKLAKRSSYFPAMATWVPSTITLSNSDKSLIWGPNAQVRKFPRAEIGAIKFRSAEAERHLTSRGSFFSFDSSFDEKTVFREYGRVLYFCEVKFNNQLIPVASLTETVFSCLP